MKWFQKQIVLSPRTRGVHLVSRDIFAAAPDLNTIKTGLCHLFMQHTSASLSINENADPDVRRDLESYLNRHVPEHEPYFTHVLEGADDMPAHIKAVLVGPSLTLPIRKGQLALGTWQGIYLLEHRNHGGSRKIMMTCFGESQ